jgi:hypothetical protein
MHELTDMGLSEEKRNHKAAEEAMPSKPPKYPYGLNIRLEAEQIAALGLDEMPDAGDKLHMMAHGVVDTVSAGLNSSEGPSISIQITALSIEFGEGKKMDDMEEGNPKPKHNSNLMSEVDRY